MRFDLRWREVKTRLRLIGIWSGESSSSDNYIHASFSKGRHHIRRCV